MCGKYSVKHNLNLISQNQSKTRYPIRIINVSISIKFVKQEQTKQTKYTSQNKMTQKKKKKKTSNNSP